MRNRYLLSCKMPEQQCTVSSGWHRSFFSARVVLRARLDEGESEELVDELVRRNAGIAWEECTLQRALASASRFRLKHTPPSYALLHQTARCGINTRRILYMYS